MNFKTRHFAIVTCLLATAACGSAARDESVEPEATSKQERTGAAAAALSQADFTTATAVASKYSGYLGTVVSLYNAYEDFINPPRDLAMEIDAMKEELAELDADIQSLGAELEARLNDVEAKGRNDLVHSWRTYSMTAFGYAALGYDTESMAAAAADVLSDGSLFEYTSKPAGGPARFQPRVTAASFMDAGNNFILIRGMLKRPMDDTARAKVRGYADRLDDVASKIQAHIMCRSYAYDVVQHTQWDGKTRTSNACVYHKDCNDTIAGVDDWFAVPRQTAGKCSAAQRGWGGPELALANSIGAQRYFLDLITQTSAWWREVANQP
jgi:hypothetical protein